MASTTSFPLLRLGRIQLDPRLRALRPGIDASDLVVTAAVPVPDSPGEVEYFWEVAWTDAVRQAGELGATAETAQALNIGTGDAQEHGPGTRVVVAAHGEVLHEQWLGQSIGQNSVQVGPLPYLAGAASAAAARPACVVVVADRDGADVIAHASGSEVAVEHFLVGKREPSQTGHVREKPPAVHHGERHLTDSEPDSGGQRSATEVAARISDAAVKVGAHIVLGAGDQHILDAVSAHLTGSLGPIITIDGRRTRSGRDDHMGPAIGAALDQIVAAAASEIGDQIASLVGGENPGAVRGVKAVAQQLAEQQVAVLLLAADISRDEDPSNSYVLGSSPTELLPANVVTGLAVPLEEGLVWAALHQDAIVLRLADRTGPLAGEGAAALLRRGEPRRREGRGMDVAGLPPRPARSSLLPRDQPGFQLVEFVPGEQPAVEQAREPGQLVDQRSRSWLTSPIARVRHRCPRLADRADAAREKNPELIRLPGDEVGSGEVAADEDRLRNGGERPGVQVPPRRQHPLSLDPTDEHRENRLGRGRIEPDQVPPGERPALIGHRITLYDLAPVEGGAPHGNEDGSSLILRPTLPADGVPAAVVQHIRGVLPQLIGTDHRRRGHTGLSGQPRFRFVG